MILQILIKFSPKLNSLFGVKFVPFFFVVEQISFFNSFFAKWASAFVLNVLKKTVFAETRVSARLQVNLVLFIKANKASVFSVLIAFTVDYILLALTQVNVLFEEIFIVLFDDVQTHVSLKSF